MRTETTDVHARLDAWREQGLDRRDPLRFAVMSALARRAACHDGAVRQRLDARLQELAEVYAGLLARPPAAQPSRSDDASRVQALLAALAEAPRGDAVAPITVARPASDMPRAIAPDAVASMPVLDEFRALWGRIRIDRLLRQCLEALPEDAGPLHSRVLTGRAMALMREVSPEYLQHFVAYADLLAWLELLQGGGSGGDAAAAPTRGVGRQRKRSRRAPAATDGIDPA